MPKQVADRDRPSRRDDVIAPTPVGDGHGPVRKLREILCNWIGNEKLTALLKNHHTNADQGFRLRGNPKDRVIGHRRAGLTILHADRLQVHDLAAPRDDCDCSCHPIARHIVFECGREPFQAFRRHPNRVRVGRGKGLRTEWRSQDAESQNQPYKQDGLPTSHRGHLISITSVTLAVTPKHVGHINAD